MREGRCNLQGVALKQTAVNIAAKSGAMFMDTNVHGKEGHNFTIRLIIFDSKINPQKI